MPTVSQTLELDAADADALLTLRGDILQEEQLDDPDAPEGTRVFGQARGPMSDYRREIRLTDRPDGRVDVEETTRFRLAVPFWGLLFVPLLRREMRRTRGRQRTSAPPWAPPEMLDTQAATVLGLLCSLALVAGYLGTLMTQTVTFAADEFGRGTTAQAGSLAVVRVGVLVSLVMVATADRLGRRRVLLAAMAAGCLVSVLGAVAPNLAVLAATQTIARGFTTASTVLLAIVAAEEMPAGARAFSMSVMTMTGALGAGISLWALPLADTSERGWRILYLIPLLGVPIVLAVGRRLPETRRFVRPHRDATVLRGHGSRLVIMATVFFCISAFGAPASQLLNDFLRDERGFSAARISLFTVLTSTPAGIALVIGGRVSDTRGKRWIVAGGSTMGSILAAWSFGVSGWSMWVLSLGGTMLGGLMAPALQAYGPELFPTGARGKANGVIQVFSVAGAASGLLVAGTLADRTGSLFNGMLVLTPLPILVGVLALVVLPETARRELEDLNPEDALDATTSATPAPDLLP